jgi:hypothetical protein
MSSRKLARRDRPVMRSSPARLEFKREVDLCRRQSDKAPMIGKVEGANPQKRRRRAAVW